MKVESIQFNNFKTISHAPKNNGFFFQTSNANVDNFQTTITPETLWIKDKTILLALKELKKIKFKEEDVAQLKKEGIPLPFANGKDAADYIARSNIRIKFDKLSSSTIHAQYNFDDNFIQINELYKNTQNPSEISAIASAILHETGHAKDQDGQSSIQEELECLALNAVAYRSSMETNKHAPTSDAFIIKEGVELYSKLFFEEPTKEKLIERIKIKYGFLPTGDFKHPPSKIAFSIKELY